MAGGTGSRRCRSKGQLWSVAARSRARCCCRATELRRRRARIRAPARLMARTPSAGAAMGRNQSSSIRSRSRCQGMIPLPLAAAWKRPTASVAPLTPRVLRSQSVSAGARGMGPLPDSGSMVVTAASVGWRAMQLGGEDWSAAHPVRGGCRRAGGGEPDRHGDEGCARRPAG